MLIRTVKKYDFWDKSCKICINSSVVICWVTCNTYLTMVIIKVFFLIVQTYAIVRGVIKLGPAEDMKQRRCILFGVKVEKKWITQTGIPQTLTFIEIRNTLFKCWIVDVGMIITAIKSYHTYVRKNSMCKNEQKCRYNYTIDVYIKTQLFTHQNLKMLASGFFFNGLYCNTKQITFKSL